VTFTLNFESGQYSWGATYTTDITKLPGYTYTRSGAKQELAATSGLVSFAANVPGIVPNVGYWARTAMTNLLLQSQAFESAVWVKSVATVVVNSSAPDDSVTADKIVPDNLGVASVLQSVTTAATSTYTFSVFAKPSGFNWLEVAFFDGVDGQRHWFNLATGALGSTDNIGLGFTSVSASTKFVGSGWYRCTLTVTTRAGTAMQVYQYPTNGDLVVTPGDGTSGVHLWQAQLVAGNQPGPVIVTTTAAATVGADALAVGVANGKYNALFTFDDNSTQTIAVTVSGGSYALPVYPTLIRSLVKRLLLETV